MVEAFNAVVKRRVVFFWGGDRLYAQIWGAKCECGVSAACDSNDSSSSDNVYCLWTPACIWHWHGIQTYMHTVI